MVLLGSSFKNYMAGFLFGLLLGVVKSPTFVEKHGDMFSTPQFLTNYFEVNSNNGGYESIRVDPPAPPNNPPNARRDDVFAGAGYRIG